MSSGGPQGSRKNVRLRALWAIGLGIGFLILLTWLGTLLTSIVPHRVTAQVQTVEAGSYTVTLTVNPDPPRITQPAMLSIHVLLSASKQPVSNAHVTLGSNMETMDMRTDHEDARPQGDGMYVAQVQFSMSGLWQVQVNIAAPGGQSVSAVFEVDVQ